MEQECAVKKIAIQPELDRDLMEKVDAPRAANSAALLNAPRYWTGRALPSFRLWSMMDFTF